jgi:multidrug efflux pump
MNFTELLIRRPVLATVISLLILVLGLRTSGQLPILQYPDTQNAVVTVSTTYYGADAAVVAGFITTPLEASIAQANGIDYLNSTSTLGSSVIQANLRLNYDADKALTEITARVNAVRNQLPAEAQQPTITIAVGQTIASMYIGFSSSVLQPNQVTDYLVRVVQPKLQAIEGVQQAELQGAKLFALRAWLDPDKLTAYGLTASDINTALAANNYVSAVGGTKGQMVQVDLTASTGLHSLAEFRKLIIREKSGAFVRLEDVANVTLGSEEYETQAGFDGKPAIHVAIRVAPSANLLKVVGEVRRIFPEIEAALPAGLTGKIAYDATAFVNSSIEEVISTLLQALLIVTLVVFAFLGSPRSVLIPTIAIPLSLIGAFPIMLALGFSINLLTLLALVLAIGLVVDDAIIVVEGVNRHIDDGMSPMDAAILAARELTGPIIAMTVVLVAVYVPIGLMGGLTGALFTEFAFTLVAAVIMSAVIALTLSPMMCSRLLRGHGDGRSAWEQWLITFIDNRFEELRHVYNRILHHSLETVPVTVAFAVLVLSSLYFLYSFSKTELAPQEDQGIIIGFISSAPNATLAQREQNVLGVYNIYAGHKEMDHVFQIDGQDRVVAGMVMVPWNQRSITTNKLQPQIQAEFSQLAAARVVAFQPPPLPGAQGLPVQFVIQSTDSLARMKPVIDDFLQEVVKSGRFIFIDKDLKIDKPLAEIVIDRERAAELGLTMRDLSGALTPLLGGGYVNYFSLDGRSYKVVPQIEQQSRLNVDQLQRLYIRDSKGVMVPLSTVAHIENHVVPEQIAHFQQLNAATLSGVPLPTVTVGDALAYLKQLAKERLPQGYSIDYSGPARQFVQESSALVMTFFFALIIIYLALAAQFESFRDPLIILVSVPMSICGALIFICMGVGGASLNIYTEVGLVTLIGLISKHGILIVEFANKLQETGLSKRAAIEEAASIRLRPILMTTAAMVLGMVPLLIASGAGAESRFNMGLVLASGVAIGTVFTLFVVPAIYLLLAVTHSGHKPVQTTQASAV